jgi:peptidoglycan/LPS O-acetylase OafA/YrhL
MAGDQLGRRILVLDDLTNWRAAWGYEYKNISHFWTLAIEEQFYLVWPAVVFFARRRSIRWVCLALFAGGFLARGWWHAPDGRPLLSATPMWVDSLA